VRCSLRLRNDRTTNRLRVILEGRWLERLADDPELASKPDWRGDGALVPDYFGNDVTLRASR
jgi:hypothetical protein